jgi:hypothetical protein
MEQVDVGLRHRIERMVRQIGSQHRSLGALYGDLTEAFGMDARTRASGLYERYAEAISAHFSLEEACLFPACRGLNPEIGRELHELCLEHEFFVTEMKRLQRRVFEDEAADGKGALDEFYAAIGVHEKKEERLVRRFLTAEPGSVSSMRVSRLITRII